MGEVFLRRLSRWQAEDQAAGLAELHADAHRDAPGPALEDRQTFLRRFTDHVQQAEFEMVIAADPDLVGGAYGFLIERHGSWWDRFSAVPPELAALTDVAGSARLFVLADLMVRSGYRRRGIGGRLADQVLARTAAPLAVAVLAPGQQAARDAFAAWGWQKTGDLTAKEDDQPLEAWTVRLPPDRLTG